MRLDIKNTIYTIFILGLGWIFLANWAGYENSQFGILNEFFRLGRGWVGAVIESDEEINWGDWQEIGEEGGDLKPKNQ